MALLSLQPNTNRMCWTFVSLRNLSQPVAAYVHIGTRGATGPVVVPFGAVYKPRGCIVVAPVLVNAIASSPRGYYLSIATRKYPKGALRAQL